MRFVADCMLGSLAKWLRVLGFDTIYQRSYGPGFPADFPMDDRILLSRQQARVASHPGAVLIRAERTGPQLMELRESLGIDPPSSQWLSRCIRCNAPLEPAPDNLSETVPDYVQAIHHGAIRFCPVCRRCFWPGTHRERMLAQLADWGFPAG
ncbi:Mut7-C RNAse domain-containing protein [Desulfatiglans anilini]|uniref:Mut7-C RNAse domain-containing protein n=1 Tax=Desulfatiglans anilini TaxID=90728 RepID=UPI0004232E9E|nr:Mut7-C RNAse domain-containing protein [Desulfatiglans anilini]